MDVITECGVISPSHRWTGCDRLSNPCLILPVQPPKLGWLGEI